MLGRSPRPHAPGAALVAASEAAAAVAGRLSGQIAEQLMAALDWRLAMDNDTAAWTDEPHLRTLVAIAAGDHYDNARATFDRISPLFALKWSALRAW